MKKFRLFCLCLLCLPAVGVSAQVMDKVLDILGTDSLSAVAGVKTDTDSVTLDKVREELAAARLNEANLRMEIEQMRLVTYAADSVKLARQKQRIDSLRHQTTPQQRAENVSHEITTLGKRFNLHPDSVYIESTDIVTDVMYGDKVIVSFTDQDGLWESCTRDQLAAAKRTVIVEKLKVMKEEHGLLQLFKRIAYFVLVLVGQVLVLVGQFLLFKLTNWLFRKLKVRILRLRNTRLKAFSIQDFELLDTQKQVRLLVFVANLFRYAFMLLQLLLTVPMLFAIFPQTKDLAYQLFFYIWDPVKSILYGILAYIPNLFTIFIICLAIKYLVRLFRYLAGEVQSERLKLNGFYPDWAMPTYHIIRFLLYAFMVAMIYPYLPGADSGVFQGISVFVGLIVSLGSSTVIGNIIAGLVITYMRPFKLGDRIQLNETSARRRTRW